MTTQRPTPLTDAFLSSLWLNLKRLNLRKTDLARFLGPPTTKQKVNSWSNGSRRPCSESLLKIQAWEKLK